MNMTDVLKYTRSQEFTVTLDPSMWTGIAVPSDMKVMLASFSGI